MGSDTPGRVSLGALRKQTWGAMRSKSVSSTPPWLGSSSCFDSLPQLLWRWTTSCKLKISHFLPKLLLVMAIYHSGQDPDCIRGMFVSSWLKVHAVLPCVWTLLRLPFGQEGGSLPFSDPHGGFGALMSPALTFSQRAYAISLHSTRGLCQSAFAQERAEGLDIYLSCVSSAPGTPSSVHKNPCALVLNPEAFRDKEVKEVILESGLYQLLRKQMAAESTWEPSPPIFCLAIVKMFFFLFEPEKS